MLCIWIFVSFGIVLLTNIHSSIKKLPSDSMMDQQNYFVIDNTARGVLGRLVLPLPPDKLVWVESQGDLLSSREWINNMPDKFVWLSNLSKDSTLAGRNELFARLAKDYLIEEKSYYYFGFRRKFFDASQVFFMTKKHQEQSPDYPEKDE